MSRARLILLLALVMGVSACGGGTPTPLAPAPTARATQTTAPTRPALVLPTAPAGWKNFTLPAFQIALPDTWSEVNLNENALRAAIETAQENNPPLVEPLRALLDSGQYKTLSFYATESGGGTVARNVSITHLTSAGTNDVSALAKAYGNALPEAVRGAKVVETHTPLKVNGLDAAEIDYDLSLVDENGELATLRGVQYIFLPSAGDAYIVTVTGDAAEADKLTQVARGIGRSFVVRTQ